ncbi:chemotaxis protein CheA [Salinivibrio sharmensis]|uniref:Chemotaxis protein CheA n=1 Tax=Salinivibrio sharmensis TaxID=390883 RepID=A0ABX3KI84_9GAMM|nr:chemotaxis protein CheA [Salinivibrio sharmensis]OOE89000.1 chemotaxis protein CheA [Salinivibrio sharmensis]
MSDPVLIFQEEAAEHLENLESALLELEQHPQDERQINVAFRAMHTIKGAAGMVGYDHLSYFTHHLETLFENVRNGSLALDQELINLVLECRDQIEGLLTRDNPSVESMTISETLIVRLTAAMPDNVSSQWDSGCATATADSETVMERIYRIDLSPNLTSFQDGFDLLPVVRELQSLGPCFVSGYLDKDFATDTFDPENCYLSLTVLLTTSQGGEALDDVFIFVQDDWRIEITDINYDEAYRLGQLFVQQGVTSAEELENSLSAKCLAEKDLTRPGAAEPEVVERTLATQNHILEQQRQVQSEPEKSIKVSQRKLDQLMDQVGELVILQARLDRFATELADEQIESLAEELTRLSSNLRETTFDIRMLPIGSTFGRFRRLVRDLAKDLNKEVVLETSGAETELDKVVIDKLADPLVHLLRNSLDHGIESPESRQAAGKPRKGTIRLDASHQQGQIVVTISDDGAGINSERVFSRAVERGLISASQNLSHAEIYQLILEPGFSTAETISDVSGRGVGMDVVKNSIESLQGRIYIDSSQGRGTVVRIMLPMTLAIIDGLMVQVSDDYYVLPLSTVEECIETLSSQVSLRDGGRLVQHRDQLVSCVRLREWFDIPGKQPAIEQTVVVRIGDDILGITVDDVVGHFQTVIKNLGKLYEDVEGVMGATIMGSGGIAMIIDVAALVGNTSGSSADIA